MTSGKGGARLLRAVRRGDGRDGAHPEHPGPGRGRVPAARPVQPDQFVFSSHDLHAWPELYFAGSGWMRFEPTPQDRTGRAPSYTTTVAASEAAPTSPPAVPPTTARPSSLKPQASPQPGHHRLRHAERHAHAWLALLVALLVLLRAGRLWRCCPGGATSRRRRRRRLAGTRRGRLGGAPATRGRPRRRLAAGRTSPHGRGLRAGSWSDARAPTVLRWCGPPRWPRLAPGRRVRTDEYRQHVERVAIRPRGRRCSAARSATDALALLVAREHGCTSAVRAGAPIWLPRSSSAMEPACAPAGSATASRGRGGRRALVDHVG